MIDGQFASMDTDGNESLKPSLTRMLDKMCLHLKMLRAWMVTLLAFRKKISTNS